MKQFSFFLFSFFLFQGFISAQTITRDHLPVVEDSVHGVFVTNQMVWSPGSAGTNQTWDFSAWAGDPVDFMYDAVEPSSPFAGSEMKLGLPGMGDLYFNSSSTEYFLTGTHSSAGGESVSAPYSDPQKIFTFPFSFSSSVTDTARGSFPVSIDTDFGPVNGQNDRTVYSVSTADGTGTLNLPNHTYDNVLRVKVVSTIKDSMYVPGMAMAGYHIEESSTEEYFFFSQDYNHQLVYMMRAISTAQPNPIEMAFYFPGATILGNAKKLVGSVNVYPNPTSSSLHFEGITSGTSLSIKNNLGVEVKSEAVLGNSEVSVDGLQPGIYFYELIKDGQQVGAGRFTKI